MQFSASYADRFCFHYLSIPNFRLKNKKNNFNKHSKIMKIKSFGIFDILEYASVQIISVNLYYLLVEAKNNEIE